MFRCLILIGKQKNVHTQTRKTSVCMLPLNNALAVHYPNDLKLEAQVKRDSYEIAPAKEFPLSLLNRLLNRAMYGIQGSLNKLE